ncbi:MAG: hypothetical protein JWQ54_1522 [Mucilaginibacter sp.]|nr:hypothetical protein [Mucilaginibacter sp.]
MNVVGGKAGELFIVFVQKKQKKAVFCIVSTIFSVGYKNDVKICFTVIYI